MPFDGDMLHSLNDFSGKSTLNESDHIHCKCSVWTFHSMLFDGNLPHPFKDFCDVAEEQLYQECDALHM